MSLYKRGDVWWYDFTYDHTRYRESTGLRGKTAAAKVEERAKERARLGAPDRPTHSLEQAANKWFIAKQAGRKGAKTVAQRLEILFRHIDPAKPVTGVDTPDFADAIAARQLEPTRQSTQHKDAKPKAPSNATINRDLIDTTGRPIMRYAKRVLKEPVNDIDWKELRLEEPKERVRSFTPVEMGNWDDRLAAHHLALKRFLQRYGVRLTEAFFPLDRINTETWEITVRGPRRKNGRPHVIPLIEEDAWDIAARLSRAQAAGLDTVWFKEKRDGSLVAMTPRGYQSAAKTALVKANIGDARPAHDLRHHAGTAAMRASGNMRVVQALLGHENIQSSARYAHADQSDVLRALRHASATTDVQPVENTSTINDKTAVGRGT